MWLDLFRPDVTTLIMMSMVRPCPGLVMFSAAIVSVPPLFAFLEVVIFQSSQNLSAPNDISVPSHRLFWLAVRSAEMDLCPYLLCISDDPTALTSTAFAPFMLSMLELGVCRSSMMDE